MSDNEQRSGLLSKVARFMKNPATNWSELDKQESDSDTSSYSKQALKEMIERKRRNDFVRKREFDMLRKIRQREAMGGGPIDASARPSFFQSSMPSRPDDRAMTLKKIDEIEAQMSMQWWKTNVPNSTLSGGQTQPASMQSGGTVPPKMSPGRPVSSVGATAAPPQPHAQADAKQYERTAPAALPTDRSGSMDLDFTANAQQRPAAPAPYVPPPNLFAPPAPPATMPTARAAVTPAASAAVHQQHPAENGASGFSAPSLFALEVDEIQHDAELEEASIRFANGDDTAAEASLLESLAGTRAHHEETWLTLFDFYRATGAREKFETQGLNFASKFNRSAPAWLSLPELVSKMAASINTGPEPEQAAHWTCPQSLGQQSVTVLRTTLNRTQAPWRIDWTRLLSIEANACEPLTQFFMWLATQQVRLEFLAPRALDETLKKLTPSGQNNVAPMWWKLRMEVLRVMQRPDEFELAALDYCVTYEVSPPSWEGVKCTFKSMDPDSRFGASTIIGDAFKDSLPSSVSAFGDNNTQGSKEPHLHQTSVELAGQIQGDATAALDRLEHKLLGADLMSISCAKLIRVDFSAAGTLLNWVSARQSEGRLVQFTDVHRLVAAFFHVIGISEHARVMVRKD
jgi:ABC-type transporter Mla MlaB component